MFNETRFWSLCEEETSSTAIPRLVLQAIFVGSFRVSIFNKLNGTLLIDKVCASRDHTESGISYLGNSGYRFISEFQSNQPYN